MRRETEIYLINPGMDREVERSIAWADAEINALCRQQGAMNASCWTAAGYLFMYAEFEDDSAGSLSRLILPYRAELDWAATRLGGYEDMELMYSDIGSVSQDKSLVRRRVFAAILKPGCADEYRRRHRALMDARGGTASDGAETNFTIHCAQGKYIFGYCELIKSKLHPLTKEEQEAKSSWELKQLQIMDWITNDVDWLSGETHAVMRNLFLQKGY